VSDDDELFDVVNYNRNKRRVPKIRNYVEHVVAFYTDVEFKSRFELVYIHILYLYTKILHIKYIHITAQYLC